MKFQKVLCRGTLRWIVGMMVLLISGGAAIAQNDSPRSLKLGVRSDCPPFSYLPEDRAEDSKDYRGFSVDLCREIAINAQAFLNYQGVDFVKVTAQDRFRKLNDGEIDILCEATTVTQERMRRFGPTMYTFISGASLMYSPLFAKTSNTRVGVLKGTTTKGAIRTILDRQSDVDRSRIRDFEIYEADTHLDCLAAFLDDKINLYMADREILLSLSRMAMQKKQSLIVSNNYYTIEPYALFLRTDDHKLRYIANLTLSEVFKEDIHQIFRDNFPGKRMNDSLRQLFRLQQLLQGSDPLADQ
jgi:ABC-type amino acid transport substrate-binding protein